MSIEEKTQRMYGRRIIFTDVDEITEQNVISVLEDTLPVHEKNKAEIKYLYNYWKARMRTVIHINPVTAPTDLS